MKEAAEVIQDTPSALQLRYLQTLNSIAAEKNSTIVFPIPMEFFQSRLSSTFPLRSRNSNQRSNISKDDKSDKQEPERSNDEYHSSHLLDTESAFPDSKPLQVTFGIPF